MTLHVQAPFKTVEPERALHLGVGAAVVPIWATFFAAAGAGVAFWWMTGWTRRAGAFAAEGRAPETTAPAERRSFAAEPAAPANDAETAAPEAVMAHVPAPAPEAAPAPAAALAHVMDHAPVKTPVEIPVEIPTAVVEADPADGLAAAQEALEATQDRVAELAAEASVAALAEELAPKGPRRKTVKGRG